MRLFQEHKVNPMSGCLPMIIQMPVWFALYNVMLYSVELYGTSFLYLKDLTEVDPTGFLPLAVTVLMVLQQKLMPLGSMDPMQQKMMRIMPIGFGLFMFTFPAGLVLYFSVNNLLTILQQWLIYRKKTTKRAAHQGCMRPNNRCTIAPRRTAVTTKSLPKETMSQRPSPRRLRRSAFPLSRSTTSSI